MDTKYLERRFNTWLAVVEIPKPLRGVNGLPKKRFVQSLQTDSLAAANRRKLPLVHTWHSLIEAAKGAHDPRTALLREAVEWRAAVNGSSLEVADDHRGHSEREWLEGEAMTWAVQQPAALRPLLVAKIKGTGGTVLKERVEPWLVECPDKGQTISQHRSTVARFREWAGDLVTVEEVDRVKAGEYVTHLLTASGLARRTVKRHLSSLSQCWLWLDSKGTPKCANVWLGHRLGKKAKGSGSVRKGLSDEKVLKLLQRRYSTEKYAQVLADLSRLALLHGARLDELCALKKTDVTKREDGYWIAIGDGKTDSAVREIPVHDAAVPLVERRLDLKGEWLFEGLEPGGPDAKRSWYVSKAWGRFRRQAGVDQPFEDFHALRNTFLELVEGEEMAESTAKLLVGHKRQSMTYGHYSKGQRVNLRSAMQKVVYSPAIMQAI